MDDPYDEVKSEVESSLQHLSSLLASYARLLRNPQTRPDDLSYAHSELLALLSALDNDVDELQQALQLVERDPLMRTRLGLGQAVLAQRRTFVETVKAEMKTARKQLAPSNGVTSSKSSRSQTQKPTTTIPNPLSSSSTPGKGAPYRDSPYDAQTGGAQVDEESDPNAEFEMQHQSLLIEQQDQTLTSISGTVEQLRSQAWTMGQEVYDQNAMLEELDREVDATGTRLERAQRRMDRFIKQNKSTLSNQVFNSSAPAGVF
ncbi:BQ2448_6843 [Microbotryum intermedium]|uniref:BQ2448_6843 protein n=1 Tax=Microbotryum intermedium TaxID=269621 RepID=A0A238FQD6_9BASI|nr:BQ2448_6843 [Microbotryum intermedium]